MSSTLDDELTILAVDDCTVTRKAIKKILGDDYKVLLASSAKEALSVIYKEPINLLLLDVSMPEIDGLELCRTVRQIPQFEQLPIIMLTARDGAFDKVKGRMAGATEYLTKPFDAEQLRQIVAQFLGGVTPTQEFI